MKAKTLGIITSVSAIGLLVLLAIIPIVIVTELRAVSNVDALPIELLEITVQPGDTLWSIAKTNVPHKDPRDVIAALRSINELDSARIFPGQTLQIEIPRFPKSIRVAKQIH